jgi:hypothetical protein
VNPLEQAEGASVTHRQPGAAALVAAQDLLQPLELALVVAEDERRLRACRPLQRAHVAIHRRRGADPEVQRVGRGDREVEPREPVPPRAPVRR